MEAFSFISDLSPNAFPSPIAVPGIVRGLGLRLVLVLAEDCLDGLLTGGIACSKVEQLPRRLQFAASELVDECFIGHAEDERSDHVRIHDVGKLVALPKKVVDVLA